MITTLSGSNVYLLKVELRKLTNNFVKKSGDFGLEKIDGEEAEYNRIREALQSQPFLADKKLVVLRAPSAQKRFMEEFDNLLPTIPDETDVVIIEPKVDKRSAYYKSLKKNTDYQEFTEPQPEDLAKWLVAQAKKLGGKLSSADAIYLVDRAGAHQQRLANELQKLVTFNTEISRQNIDMLTILQPRGTIFDLIDAALQGRTKTALAIYADQRRNKVEPQQIIALMTWQLHAMATILAAGQQDPYEMATQTGLSPFVIKKNLPVVERLGRTGIKKLINDLAELDVKLKTKNVDADDALQYYLITMTVN